MQTFPKDVEQRFNSSNHELDEPSPQRKKDELSKIIMKELAALKAKTQLFIRQQ